MAKRKTKTPPEVPWQDTDREVTEPGIGIGFVAWSELGQALRGTLLRRWRSSKMRSPAVTVELTEVPTVPIFNTEGEGEPEQVECEVGDKINVSLTHDLDRKLTRDLEGDEIGVYYEGDQPTPKGSMRIFKVFVFAQDDLPF